MDARQIEAYSFQSPKDPEKWYEVILGTSETPYRTRCTCSNFLQRKQICDHIEKALGIRALDL